MRVLVLGPPSAVRTRLEKLLDSAGDLVDVCHEAGWGCVGLDERCPVDVHDVDVAVAVSAQRVQFEAGGVACIHRARIPLVTIGAKNHDPISEYATANVARADGAALDAIRSAATDATSHERKVEEALAEHLADDEGVSVTVRRRSNALDVVLTGDLAPGRSVALADVARAAIRAHDERAAVINVSTSRA